MSVIVGKIGRVKTNGPFMYIIEKDGVGEKAVTGVPTLGAAFNGVRDDIGALVGAEVVQVVTVQVRTAEPAGA